MRVLVAGGSGFVGGHLCRRLLDDGHVVTCLDSLITGRRENVADLLGRDRFSFVEADIVEMAAATLPGEPPDLIIHLASPASPVDYTRYPLETLAVNSMGTWRLLEVAEAAGAAMIYVSTSEAYGDPLVHPQPETYWGNVDPVGPRSCYDEGKRFGEALVTNWRRARSVRAAIVRVFNTYGPGMRLDDGRVVPEFLAAARSSRPLPIQGDGLQTRSYMFVSDLVDGLLHVALDPELDGLLLNVGNPEEVTVSELAARVLRLSGSTGGTTTIAGRPGDPQRRRPDIARMRSRYGWQPVVTLDDGLQRTIDWVTTTGVAAGGTQG